MKIKKVKGINGNDDGFYCDSDFYCDFGWRNYDAFYPYPPFHALEFVLFLVDVTKSDAFHVLFAAFQFHVLVLQYVGVLALLFHESKIIITDKLNKLLRYLVQLVYFTCSAVNGSQ